MNDDAHIIFNALGRVLESAEKNQKASSDATAAISRSADKLEEIALQLDNKISSSFDVAMRDVGEKLTEKFSKATEMAEQAESNYRRAANFAPIKVVAVASIGGIIIFSAILYLIQRSQPSPEDVHVLIIT